MKTKILVKNKKYELPDCCKWKVENGILRNLNTGYYEGVDGDEVTYTLNDELYRGHVEGYTCFQFIQTKEWGKVILSAQEYHKNPPIFIHHTKVELI